MSKLFLEDCKYVEQYGNAIFRLMNNSDISNYELPLINLIHQLIENELKSLIAESWYNEKTYKELGISNEHNLSRLIDRDELKKYYIKIEELEEIFKNFREMVLYFDTVLGENTFLNSRYAIQTKKNENTIKNKFDYNEFYSNWSEYCETYRCLIIAYSAYSFSNTILYKKKQKYSEHELLNLKIDILNEMLEESDEESIKTLNYLIDKFVERNEYYDEKYIN